ncbi:hypothetical protein [Rhodanobacter sp. Soil772]|uniref:hypothetical protein n=1 Tax=Rhodanobacter sp. Soil772 TaxID=1736406 RepID=UPI001F297023|nr:hypothetical protein [Rhodanobacter sp. Soil772]
MSGGTSSPAARLAAPGMNRRRFLDRAFGRSLGVRQLQGSKLFWPEERPDVIAEEARRLWAAQGDQA